MSVMNPTNTSSGLTQNNSTLIMRLINNRISRFKRSWYS